MVHYQQWSAHNNTCICPGCGCLLAVVPESMDVHRGVCPGKEQA